MNHYEYYKECLKTGLLKGNTVQLLDGSVINVKNGLCNEPDINQNLLTLFAPTRQDVEFIFIDSYWASIQNGHDDYDCDDDYAKFNTLRQTIVLFIAAIHDEL